MDNEELVDLELSTEIKTPVASQIAILAELWMNYRHDEEFADFVEYNDLGLPLAYAIANNIVETSVIAENFVQETFSLLLTGLELEDEGYDSIDEILDIKHSQ